MSAWNVDFYSAFGETWVHQVNEDHSRQFLARFKYANPGRSAKHFIKFLVANFTPEEFFEQVKSSAPVTVLEKKGFVSYNKLRAQRSK